MKVKPVYFLALLLLFASCNRRNLAYISDIQGFQAYKEPISNAKPAIIKPDDLLGIRVSSLNQEAAAVFNRGGLPAYGATGSSIASVAGERSGESLQVGYLVDEDGYIDFPVLNKVHLAGLTKKEAQAKLVECLQRYLKDPTVNLRYLNFRITVIGEVKQPSSFTIPNDQINIFEVLGMAGDMTPFGKRENVLLMREEGGERTVIRLNLNDKEILNSPYFYLQQNDVVYVETVRAKVEQASITRSYITTAATVVTALSLLIFRIGR
jgi:polysaccharide export outer membrane protein